MSLVEKEEKVFEIDIIAKLFRVKEERRTYISNFRIEG